MENENETSFTTDCIEPNSTINCIWHDEIQKRIEEIEQLRMNHKQQDLSDDQSKENREFIQKFLKGGKKGLSMWKRIENFYCKPAVFKLRDLQIYLEEDFKRENPSISDEEIRNEMQNLINKIENLIREDFKLEYSHLSENEIENKVREVKVKGYLTGDREKYFSDKAEFMVEEAIGKIMFNKPGLLRRGLKTDKKTYQHLKNILGQVTPNCSDENCQHKADCYQMEADLISVLPSGPKLMILLIEVKKSRGENINTSLGKKGP